VWFVVLGMLGLTHIAQGPQVLRALNPWYGIRLLIDYPGNAIGLLGSLVLVITGAEALYADMGHFGRKSIRKAWYFVAFPGLVLNYFGQGAWVLAHPEVGGNPFFALVPEGVPRLLLTGLSTAAAIVASQAMISGTFSLTRQAIQLGYFPRLTIRHTNPDQQGQIFLPLVNATLALSSIATVVGFRSVSALAGAYGVAVTCTMVVTTITFFTVVRTSWRWSGWKAYLLCAAFLTFDLSFLTANTSKIAHGGWFPLTVGAVMFAIMCTWKRGKMEIFQRVYANEVTEQELCNIAQSPHIVRIRGTGVFMAGNRTGTPLVLLHHVKANKVLHEYLILLTIVTEDTPVVADAERMEVREIGVGIWRVIGRYGYMELPDAQSLMDRVRATGVPVKPGEAVYYFNHEMVMTGGTARMWGWQKSLYAWMSRNARPARDYYRIEPSQIIEVGLPIVL
jgi:KUP system potassium uptake protein